MSVQNSVNRNYPIPIGVVLPFCGINVPKGFLKCDTTPYYISDYPELAEVLGGIYNVSPPTGQFNVPNLLGKLIQGSSTNAGTVNPAVIAPGDNVSTTLAISNIPPFSTNTTTTQPTITASIPNSLITYPLTSFIAQQGGDPSQTYLNNRTVQNHPAPTVTPSVTTNITNASQQPISIAATQAVPASYTMIYIIRATNQL